MMTGRLIQTYRVEELLGEGGMGAVFRATDTVLDRPVALKMLRADLVNQPQFMDRFRAEAQILAKLNHPNVATLYNFVREENNYYMVMEFVAGQTLDEWLATYGPLPVSLAVQVVQQALEGLHHAHKRGILHRDLKPANLMVTPEGLVKLTDFGIARVMGSQRLTHVNGLVGTPAYMAPEQIQGLDPSPQSDIHAMGLVLYELLSGQVPFATTNSFETMERVMRMMPPPLRSQLTGVPAALDAILNMALQKKADDRYADARTFQRALSTITPYRPILDETDVMAYQHPIIVTPNPIVETGKTLVEPEPTLPSSPGGTIPPRPPATPQPALVVNQAANGNSSPARSGHAELPKKAHFRWKRVALWVGGFWLIFLIVANVFFKMNRDAGPAQPADSLATTRHKPLSSLSATQGAQPISGEEEAPRKVLPKVKVSRPNNLKASRSVAEVAKPVPTPIASRPPANSSVTRSAIPTDDNELASRPTTGAPVASASRPPEPAPSTEKPRPEPVRSPVTESTPVKSESAEAKGGRASRSLKLSGGTEVVVALNESLAAASARSGQSINLHVVKPISVGGEVVVPQGAAVQGDVASVSTGGKKDMLEIHIQSIRGAGGQRISVKGGTFRQVGERNEPLVFKSGQSFVVYTSGTYKFSF